MKESSSDTDTSLSDVEDEAIHEDLIKAIRKENDRKPNNPADIKADEFVVDISFHPSKDIIAIADIVGDVNLHSYSLNANTHMRHLELHSDSCRNIEFEDDGLLLYSTSKDRSIILSDVESSRIVTLFDAAHDNPISYLHCIDEVRFATGDDDGAIHLWDRRTRKRIWRCKKNDSYISGMVTDTNKTYLICSSADGSLTTIDLQERKFFVQSHEYDEELTGINIFRGESKVVSCSSFGNLYFYNWGEFGWHNDTFKASKTQINTMLPITENIVVLAMDNGSLYAVNLYPHRHLGVVGQHGFSVEHMDISHDGIFVATSSHNDIVKFWNIEYFSEFETPRATEKSDKQKRVTKQLPSSQRKDVQEFFKNIC